MLDHFQRIAKPADGDNYNHRGEDQGENHQARLHGIRPAHGQEATDEGIKDGGCSTGPQCGFIAHAEGAFEQTSPGDNPGRTVDGEEQQDHQRGDNTQHAAFIFETAGEIVRKRQRVVVHFGVNTQTTGHQFPVNPCPDTQADGNPAFGNPGDENRAR
ncbi:hypothetical protein D3C72_1418030 [compost metagenome]